MGTLIFVLGTAILLAQGQSANQNQVPPAPPGNETPDNSDPFHPRTTVTVTATRSEAEVDRSPVSVSLVTAKEIEARPVKSIDETLSLMEGVYVQRFQGPSATDANTRVRGFDGGGRTLVLLDGQPLNDAYAGSVNWTGLPVAEMQSIEVARGPFSSLYGGNALGGVINLITRPIDRRHLNVAGEYGGYNTEHYSAGFSDRFFGKLGVSLGYETTQIGGYNSRFSTVSPAAGNTGILVTGAVPTRTSTGTPAVIVGRGGLNWLHKHAFRTKGEYAVNRSTLVTFQYLKQDYGFGYTGYLSFLRDAAGNTVDSGSFLFNNNGTLQRLSVAPRTFLQNDGEQHSGFFNATLHHEFSGTLSLRADASHYNIPTYQFRTGGTAATLISGAGTVNDGARRNHHGNILLNHRVDRNDLTYGVETRYEMASNGVFNLGNWKVKDTRLGQTYSALGRSINHSAYVQDRITITERMSLTAGVRYDYWKGYDGFSNSYTAAGPLVRYPDRVNNRLTAKAALSYSLPGGWNLRSSVGTAFRNANVFELYASNVTTAGVLQLGNPALKPETVTSWEFGARKRFGGRTDFDVAYYENYVTDLIYRKTDLAADPTGNLRINVNAGGARTRGVESSFRQEVFRGLQFRGTYTYTLALITKNPANPAIVGNRVTNIPAHMASGQFLWIHRKWTGSLSGHYAGAHFSTDTNADVTKGVPGSRDPFFLADTNLSYNVNSHLQLYVTGDNLLNRRYFQVYISPGRTVYGGFRFKL